MIHHQHNHDPLLVVLSILIAIFASYTALDLANSVSVARGRTRLAWWLGGSLAMGVGIWSMHFVGMLAFRLPGVVIAYDSFLLIVSILVAILASAMALYIVSGLRVTRFTYVLGSGLMGAAIAGMHYIGIASMRMSATWTWDYGLVVASIAIAVAASFAALQFAFRLRDDLSRRGFFYRGVAGVLMGLAISGMHYTAMMAMHFHPAGGIEIQESELLATSGLAVAVIGTTLLILGIALTGSIVDRALARREAIISSRDEFLSIASHELRTPLTSLKLQTQVRLKLLQKGDMSSFAPEKLKSLFEGDFKHIEKLTHLIDDMLEISRMSTGKLVIHREPFDLCDLAQEVLQRNQPQLEAAGCKVSLETCPPVVGNWDRFRIEQVITNLITNAAIYGGRKPVHLSVHRTPNGQVRLSVSDQGMGIARENLERVFQRFERAISATEISGLGLGLYIARQIVEMHGGRIWAESELGNGSTFTMELPLANAETRLA